MPWRVPGCYIFSCVYDCLILLSDCSGYDISLVLWGDRATAFDGGDVLQIGQGQPVVAIFVGTLVKPFEGELAGDK